MVQIVLLASPYSIKSLSLMLRLLVWQERLATIHLQKALSSFLGSCDAVQTWCKEQMEKFEEQLRTRSGIRLP